MSEPTITPAALPPAPAPAPSKHRRWPWIVGAIVAFFLGIGIGGSGQPTPPASSTVSAPSPAGPVPVPRPATAPATPAGAADTISQDGTYVIGTELQPGTYHTSPAGECYWARLSSTANESDIIANHLANGPTTVTIGNTDAAFLSNGCGTWTRVK